MISLVKTLSRSFFKDGHERSVKLKKNVTISFLIKVINAANQYIHRNGPEARKIMFIKSYLINEISSKEFESLGLKNYDLQRALTRKEFSLLFDNHILFWDFVGKDHFGKVSLK